MRNIRRGWCLIKRADATIVVSKVVVDTGGFFFCFRADFVYGDPSAYLSRCHEFRFSKEAISPSISTISYLINHPDICGTDTM